MRRTKQVPKCKDGSRCRWFTEAVKQIPRHDIVFHTVHPLVEKAIATSNLRGRFTGNMEVTKGSFSSPRGSNLPGGRRFRQTFVLPTIASECGLTNSWWSVKRVQKVTI